MDQRLITGQPAADGIVMGTAVVTAVLRDGVDRNQAGSGTAYTREDLNGAVRETQAQLRQFQKRIQKRITESVTLIFAGHLMILEDPSFIGKCP